MTGGGGGVHIWPAKRRAIDWGDWENAAQYRLGGRGEIGRGKSSRIRLAQRQSNLLGEPQSYVAGEIPAELAGETPAKFRSQIPSEIAWARDSPIWAAKR